MAEKVVDNAVVKSNRSGTFFAFVSVVAMAASMLIGTNIASADQVQVQSYQRPSQTAACAAQPGETPWQAPWGPDSSWTPSYEMWANNGTGGWVCTRSITWARTPTAAGSGGGGGSVTYRVGEIGPGGGLVFLIAGGLTYEMAPKAWGTSSAVDPTNEWCSDITSSISGAVSPAVGTGSANTTAMLAFPCTSGAAVAARAYRGGGFSDWFLPSKDELNAMCNYSRNPSAPAAPSVNCYGASGTNQDGAFASSLNGFASNNYWSSSQFNSNFTANQNLGDGNQGNGSKNALLRVRPIRAF